MDINIPEQAKEWGVTTGDIILDRISIIDVYEGENKTQHYWQQAHSSDDPLVFLRVKGERSWSVMQGNVFTDKERQRTAKPGTHCILGHADINQVNRLLFDQYGIYAHFRTDYNWRDDETILEAGNPPR